MHKIVFCLGIVIKQEKKGCRPEALGIEAELKPMGTGGFHGF
jgi:hypothetical protein